MQPDYLLAAVEVLAVIFTSVAIAIYIRLYRKKRDYFFQQHIRQSIEEWLTATIINEVPARDCEVPADLTRLLKKRFARHFVIDELVNNKKNLSGLAGQNIIALYERLDLKQDSLKKMRSSYWHIKARGIQELYLMDQQDMLTAIYKNTNSDNEEIRNEAQTGIIHLTGFDGLRFLNVVSYPITEWQQLKLLEQLRLSPVSDTLADEIPVWLQSANNSVCIFALKLADEYQQYTIHDAVASCIIHPDKQVRNQAIKTLVRMAHDDTPALLIAHFDAESYSNKLTILDGLKDIATQEQASFLSDILEISQDNVIRIRAARALAHAGPKGMDQLKIKAYMQPEPFARIYQHIKAESR